MVMKALAMLKVIIDYDGTLTAEELQVEALAERSLRTLAEEVVVAPFDDLVETYRATQQRLLEDPHLYWWEVNGLIASYCDEGAFILNTTTLQVMLRERPAYLQAVNAAYPDTEYDAVVDCTNDLFHRHTAALPVVFRPATRGVLSALIERPAWSPVVLTNSLGDKVAPQMASLALDEVVSVLGDTRQYDMQPGWDRRFWHPQFGEIHVWPVDEHHQIDLRRPAYYRALLCAAGDGSQLVVVADTLSLPGSLPLMMGIPFFLVRTPYTPVWCARAVSDHPLGYVLEDLAELPAALDALSEAL
jgi:hypothetical protein